jgi:hypothetical protein
MAAEIHPAASHHLPAFITAPGETDVLMVVTAVILLVCVLGFGVLFLTLHTLPERLAHKSQRLQFEIVAVLGLIALFTHMHIFWVIGLILALIDLPDFGGWMNRMAGSVEKIAEASRDGKTDDTPDEAIHAAKASDATIKTLHENIGVVRRGDDAAPKEAGARSGKHQERIHA